MTDTCRKGGGQIAEMLTHHGSRLCSGGKRREAERKMKERDLTKPKSNP